MNFYYINSKGERVNFYEEPYLFQSGDLLDYSWSYDSESGFNLISNVRKEPKERKVSIGIIPDTRLSYEERKELGRQIKRVEKQISDIEKTIESKENEIAEIELKLTTPEGAADASLFERHGLLTKELEEDMLKWEELTVELQNISKD